MKGEAIQHLEQLDEKLRKAAKRGSAKRMRELIKQGAGVATPDSRGLTPMYLAALSGRAECVHILMPLMPSAQRFREAHKWLMACAGAGWAEGAKLMLAAFDLAVQENGGRQPPQERMPARRRSEGGRTPLMMAATAGSPECVALLLPLSAANAADARGETALAWAAQATSGDPAACVAELLPATDPTKKNKRGQTALHLAAASGLPTVVERLAGAIDADIRDHDGKTAFDEAFARADESGEAVRQALRRGMAERERRSIDGAVAALRPFMARARQPLAL